MVKRLTAVIFYLPSKAARTLADWAVKFMTTPRAVYSTNEVTNVRALKRRLRPGDVLLVSGSARISYVVKVMTVSHWSHAVLYVGDRRDLLTEEETLLWSKTFGNAALKHLVIDADPVLGVHLKPLDESIGLLIRHCRPEALSSDDLGRVIDHALAQLGKRYDIKHVARLLLFFGFPWEFLPESLRRFFVEFRLSESDTICSRVLSEAFHSVGYPIRPYQVMQNRSSLYNTAVNVATAVTHRGRSTLRLLAGGRFRAAFRRMTDERYTELHLKGTRYITPSDYDLSRFFSVIKDSGDLGIDYRALRTLCPPS